MSDNKAQAAEPELNWDEMRPQIIKLVLELGPLVVFFLCTMFSESWLEKWPVLRTWFSKPIIFATAPFMATMAISLIVSWLLFKRVAVMPLVTLLVVLIFGTLTLLFQDSFFIKVKPTIINSLFGATLLGGLLFRQSLLKYVFGEVYRLQPKGWQVLTVRWGLFFFLLATLNEVAWRWAGSAYTDPDAADKFYAGFKLWGVMPLTVLFSMSQLPTLSKYAAPHEPPPVPPVVVES